MPPNVTNVIPEVLVVTPQKRSANPDEFENVLASVSEAQAAKPEGNDALKDSLTTIEQNITTPLPGDLAADAAALVAMLASMMPPIVNTLAQVASIEEEQKSDETLETLAAPLADEAPAIRHESSGAPISLGAISGLRTGEYSGRDSADFAMISARIAARFGRNIFQPGLPAGNPGDESLETRLTQSNEEPHPQELPEAEFQLAEPESRKNQNGPPLDKLVVEKVDEVGDEASGSGKAAKVEKELQATVETNPLQASIEFVPTPTLKPNDNAGDDKPLSLSAEHLPVANPQWLAEPAQQPDLPTAIAAPSLVKETTMQVPEPLRSIVMSTARLTAENGQEVRLQLYPDSLGRVSVQLSYEGKQVHVHLAAEVPQTSDLIQQHQADLKIALAEAGVSVGQLSVTVGDGHPRQQTAFARYVTDDFAEISARIAARFGRNIFQPGLPAGNPGDESLETRLTQSNEETHTQELPEAEFQLAEPAQQPDLPTTIAAPSLVEETTIQVPEPLRSIVMSTARLTAENGQEVRLQLYPDSLGRVSVQLSYEGKQVHVHLAAEVPQTSDLIQQHQADLKIALAEAGVSVGQLSVTVGDGHPRQQTAFARYDTADFAEISARIAARFGRNIFQPGLPGGNPGDESLETRLTQSNEETHPQELPEAEFQLAEPESRKNQNGPPLDKLVVEKVDEVGDEASGSGKAAKVEKELQATVETNPLQASIEFVPTPTLKPNDNAGDDKPLSLSAEHLPVANPQWLAEPAQQPDLPTAIAAPSLVKETTMQVPEPLRSIVMSTARLTAENGQEVRLQLYPDSLGRVSVQLSYEGKQVHVHLAAEVPQTSDLIQQHQADLKIALAEAGVSVGQLSVTVGDGHPRQQTAFARYVTELPGTGRPVATATPAKQIETKTTLIDYRI